MERIRVEISYCFTYEEGKENTCAGASGRKLRRVCIYCPNWIHRRKRGNDQKEKDGVRT